jgi:formylglycine-generating enzyme required for sulfatase activity
MGSWNKKLSLGFQGGALAASLASVVLLAWVAFLGLRVRTAPHRCGGFLEPIGARCCAPGQRISAGRCVGTPTSCARPFVLVDGEVPGCSLSPRKVLIDSGTVTLGPTDWDSAEIIKQQTISVDSFYMDEGEVTVHEYERCVQSGQCPSLLSDAEPGVPVTGLSVDVSTAFCEFRAGRLPTPAEWVFAAAGTDARRFPWGPHGLTCRRAAFGLADGPCAEGGTGPELSGARFAGATPEGVLDLAGNVAEWALSDEGNPSVHGGSYRSKHAADLKVWSLRHGQIKDDVGFRCVYPVKENGL